MELVGFFLGGGVTPQMGRNTIPLAQNAERGDLAGWDDAGQASWPDSNAPAG